ncbi:MAG: NADH-quinone oxidoreductase subunit G [Gammaproteobacteria bacterium]|nr:MAG: NADH-quinone oxidoreductase subunit G [Gammaproteobacteria bacterium]
MSDDTVNIEINGESVTARRGQMLIEVTDRHKTYVPRFCYHKKLSVAANCRMCLVEIEKAPKPLPACATPVTEGMKVFTRSRIAISAQKAMMEFLLINHPLDCPICDQGGECELQDLAMGYGRDISRYADQKRVVQDKNLGPLVSTDMTRCIHCTRCIRFGQEIAGIQELGTTGRSEHMEIGTYIERSVDHELSGNIIDLCPVGALNNKPYRFGARAWEMMAIPLVSPHDCVGSNLYGHVLRGTLKRIVPQENEAINETWISDRDRFSYEGVYTADRLTSPLLKKDQEWFDVSWAEALAATRESLLNDLGDEGDALGVLVSPSSTLEEMYLLNRLTRHLGCQNLDHRLRTRDFSDQASDPLWLSLGTSIAALDNLDGVLVIGSNLRMEVPIIAHRIRKAAVNGAAVGFVNPVPYETHFPSAAYVEAPLERFAELLAGVVVAAAELKGSNMSAPLAKALKRVEIQDAHRDAAGVLLNKERSLILLGQLAMRHPRYADIRRLAAALADLTGARLGYLPEGANAVGAALAGLLPHRGPGGRALESAGLNAHGMLASPRSVYLLFGLEPDHDLADGTLAEQALKAADTVICFTPFVTERLLECADVLLPIGTFAETAGTFVNVEGRWQSFSAAASLVGDARAGWRVLRVLGNELNLPDCEYQNAAEISEALASEIGHVEANNDYNGRAAVSLEPVAVDAMALDVPIYAVDAVVRRGTALQETRIARETRGG